MSLWKEAVCQSFYWCVGKEILYLVPVRTLCKILSPLIQRRVNYILSEIMKIHYILQTREDASDSEEDIPDPPVLKLSWIVYILETTRNANVTSNTRTQHVTVANAVFILRYQYPSASTADPKFGIERSQIWDRTDPKFGIDWSAPRSLGSRRYGQSLPGKTENTAQVLVSESRPTLIPS